MTFASYLIIDIDTGGRILNLNNGEGWEVQNNVYFHFFLNSLVKLLQ